jgi:hypothetical protein
VDLGVKDIFVVYECPNDISKIQRAGPIVVLLEDVRSSPSTSPEAGRGLRGNRHSIIQYHTVSYRYRSLFAFINTPPAPGPLSRDDNHGDDVCVERTSCLSHCVRHSQEVLRRLLHRALRFANDAVALRLRYASATTWAGWGRRG